jgi:tetratricopeptide (TPR) repeat protein
VSSDGFVGQADVFSAQEAIKPVLLADINATQQRLCARVQGRHLSRCRSADDTPAGQARGFWPLNLPAPAYDYIPGTEVLAESEMIARRLGLFGLLMLALGAATTALADDLQVCEKLSGPQAIAVCSRAIAADPKNTLLFHTRADAYNNAGDFDRALADYTTIIGLDPTDTAAYAERGKTYALKSDMERAFADFAKALQIFPQSLMARDRRAKVYYKLGQFDRAVADYTTSLAIDPKDHSAYNNRGAVYMAMNEFDLAIADFSKAIAIKRIDPGHYYNRGTAWAEKGNAMSAARRAPALKSGSLLDSIADSGNYNNEGYERAIADFTRAIHFNPNYVDAYRQRAEAREAAGDRPSAEADRAKALEIERTAR